MNLLTAIEKFPTQESCIEHLERVRFGSDPFCPLCGAVGECAQKKEGNRVGRWTHGSVDSKHEESLHDESDFSRVGNSILDPVIGAVERGGKVVARVADDLSGRGVLAFIKQAIDPSESMLVTDEFGAYNAVKS